MNDKSPHDDPPDDEGLPAVEVDLRATMKQVFLAIAEVCQRAGCAAEIVQAAQPPGRPCRVAARRAWPPGAAPPALGDGSAAPGPVLMIYEFRDAGQGHVHVRITQSGFGDEAAWDAAFAPWRGHDPRRPWIPAGGRPAGVPGLTPARAAPQMGIVPGRSIYGPTIAALVQKLDATSIRLEAMRRDSGHRWPPAAVGVRRRGMAVDG